MPVPVPIIFIAVFVMVMGDIIGMIMNLLIASGLFIVTDDLFPKVYIILTFLFFI